MPLVPDGARAGDEAIYFTWSGSDIPELFPAYIEKHGVGPEIPLFADNEETFVKMRAGFQVDVAHHCSFHTARWRDAGIIQAIDTSRLSNWEYVFPELKSLKNTQFYGEQWFVPFDWGQTLITYRTDLIDWQGEDSWALLWARISQVTNLMDAAFIQIWYENQYLMPIGGQLGCGTRRVNRIAAHCGPFSTAA
jgi:spermidine/putrescine transport system substrate-binding protein